MLVLVAAIGAVRLPVLLIRAIYTSVMAMLEWAPTIEQAETLYVALRISSKLVEELLAQRFNSFFILTMH
jgi:hypothetical protein